MIAGSGYEVGDYPFAEGGVAHQVANLQGRPDGHGSRWRVNGGAPSPKRGALGSWLNRLLTLGRCQQMAGNLPEKAGRDGGAGTTHKSPPEGPQQVQVVLGAGNAHIAQAAFLFKLLLAFH